MIQEIRIYFGCFLTGKNKVDDKQLDILDCNCVKTVKRFRASNRKISVLRTENSSVNTRTICLPSIYIYMYM